MDTIDELNSALSYKMKVSSKGVVSCRVAIKHDSVHEKQDSRKNNYIGKLRLAIEEKGSGKRITLEFRTKDFINEKACEKIFLDFFTNLDLDGTIYSVRTLL